MSFISLTRRPVGDGVWAFFEECDSALKEWGFQLGMTLTVVFCALGVVVV